ncbi:hypothetical protein [Clostridium sp.]|uniref:hypothetical protein n=1 Tax=Clostridium sp. TaxID=1506 RepID=UPI0032176B40
MSKVEFAITVVCLLNTTMLFIITACLDGIYKRMSKSTNSIEEIKLICPLLGFSLGTILVVLFKLV